MEAVATAAAASRGRAEGAGAAAVLPGGVREPEHHAVHVPHLPLPQLLAHVLPEASAVAAPESGDGLLVLSARGPVVDAGGAEP